MSCGLELQALSSTVYSIHPKVSDEYLYLMHVHLPSSQDLSAQRTHGSDASCRETSLGNVGNCIGLGKQSSLLDKPPKD
eukprot:5935115-Amphidinium_carterae.1